MRFAQRFAASALLALIPLAIACVPEDVPPDPTTTTLATTTTESTTTTTPPDPWPAPQCWGSSAGGDVKYVGPESTESNAEFYPSTDGSCIGTVAGTGTAARADDEPGALAVCATINSNYTQTFSLQSFGYTTAPSDAWACVGGPPPTSTTTSTSSVPPTPWTTPDCWASGSLADLHYFGRESSFYNGEFANSVDGTCSGSQIKLTVVRAVDGPSAMSICAAIDNRYTSAGTPLSLGYTNAPSDAYYCGPANIEPPTTTTTIPNTGPWTTPACYTSAGSGDINYVGPESTLNNATLRSVNGGSCGGSSLGNLTVVRSGDQFDALAVCQGIKPTYSTIANLRSSFSGVDATSARLQISSTAAPEQ